MKRLFLFLSFCVSIYANAQLTVLESGQTIVGNMSADKISSTADLVVCSTTSTDDPDTPPDYSGMISFGPKSNTYIQGNRIGTYLILNASRSIKSSIGTKSSVTLYENALSSSCNIKAPAFLTTSDVRLKKNITSLNDYFGRLKDVNSVSYNLTQPSVVASDVTIMSDSANQSNVSEDTRTHFGFIAQEIQKIYPNLVVEDEDGMLAIDYTGFIPLLVEAYKDLAGKVKEQEELIEALLGQKAPSYMPASVNGVADSKASLKQNKPNPQSVASAFICVYDLQGKQVHRIDIRDRGDVVNVIDASYFTPGMYIYSLIADGVEIDSKRMIITD